MGKELEAIYREVREKAGLYQRFKLAVQLKIPSINAAKIPDDPALVARARKLADELIGIDI